jgi:hypothetical protein
VKDLYNENDKTLKKEAEEDTKRKKDHPPMLTGLQNSYCENGHITKSDLEIECNPHPNPDDE